MKNIVVLIHDDDGQEARLQAALDVTRALNGHLRCVDVSRLIMLPGDDGGGSAMLLADERQRESVNKARLGRRLQHEMVSWDWQDTTGSLAGCVDDAAKLADLIVIDRSDDEGFFATLDDTASTVLLDSSAPVLAVPRDTRSFDVAGTAMIAWDGSRAAVRALREAVPLLRFARHVLIVEVDDGTIEIDGDDVAIYLSRHGITSQLIITYPVGNDASERLVKEVRDRKPEYLVMGGYGHGRMREALFGGVTRTLLHALPIPLFLAR